MYGNTKDVRVKIVLVSRRQRNTRSKEVEMEVVGGK